MARFMNCTVAEIGIINGQMANVAVFSSFVDYSNRANRKVNPRRFRKVMYHYLARGGHLISQPMAASQNFIAVAPIWTVCRSKSRVGLHDSVRALSLNLMALLFDP